jgi:ribosome-binding ATPase YchF (GTP1/OBG family)
MCVLTLCGFAVYSTGAFEDSDVTHVEGEVDPVRDFDIIAEELRLKDEDTLNKNLEKLERTVVRGNDKKLKPEYVSDRLTDRKTNRQYFKFLLSPAHSQTMIY